MMTAAAPAPLPSHDTVSIALGDRSYPILVGSGLLDAPATWAPIARPHARALVVSNETVAPLYALRLERALRAAGAFRDVETLVLPDGEAYKDWAHLQRIFDRLLETAADRGTTLIALGGGVIGDMTGFAAACYMRGVPFVQVPTTLLAQVDSSVGGKTAINHPLGKNMIGAFYQPVRVVCDLDALDTLPDREVSAGLAEVIKYGAIMDAPFLAWLESHVDALRARDKDALRAAVRQCCEFKARIVTADERESGVRALLNFGHTFGHAIEAGLGFGEWLHGEAVGCGMVMAAEVSARLGLLPAADVRRLADLVARAGLPVAGPAALGPERYLSLMAVDKKVEAGAIRYVLLESLGRAVMREAPADVVSAAIADLTAPR